VFPSTSSFLGFEFFNRVAGNSTFTHGDQTFNGKGTPPLSESQTIDLKFDIDRPTYDIGLFYSKGRYKTGIIPTQIFIRKRKTIIIDIPYHQPFGAWTLGHNKFNTDIYTVLYGEIYNFSFLKSNNSNQDLVGSLAFRLDWAKVSGKLQTYKYPNGSEWFQAPIVIEEKHVFNNFMILSIGPKIAINLDVNPLEKSDKSDNFAFLKAPLSIFSKLGLNASALWDIPIGYTGYDGYSINISLGAQFR